VWIDPNPSSFEHDEMVKGTKKIETEELMGQVRYLT
jgi:hypothetical protein